MTPSHSPAGGSALPFFDSERSSMQPTLLEAGAAVGTRSIRHWNILRDVELTGRVDAGRLRAALVRAAEVHPLSRARRVVDRSGTWTWIVAPDVANAALHAADTTAGDLNPLLRELQAERLSPTEPLAFRCIAVRGPSSDRLLFNFCHERTDGIGAMAFLSSLREAYAGEHVRSGSADRLDQRRSLEAVPPLVQTPGLVQPEPVEHLVADSGDANDDSTHVVNIALPLSDVTTLAKARDQGPSVTHRLVAALSIVCGRWNSARGRGGRICIGVPVNARPPESARQGFFNAYGTMCINTGPGERLALAQASECVAAQARYLKPIAAAAGAQLAFSTAPAIAPTGLAPTIPDGSIPTAVVSSLGVWNLGQFGGAGIVLSAWAPPLPMAPMAVALGIVGVHGTICLSFRFASSVIGRHAGHDFARSVVDLFAGTGGAA